MFKIKIKVRDDVSLYDFFSDLSFDRSGRPQQRQPTEIPVQTNLDSSNKTWLKFLQYVNVTKSDSSVLPLEASRLLSNPGLLSSDDLMFITSDNVQQFKEKVVMLDEKSEVTLLGQLKAGIVLDSKKDYEKAHELNMLFFNISDLTGKKLDQSSGASQETKCSDTEHEIKSNQCADAQETKCNLTAEVVARVDYSSKVTQGTELDHSTELLQETRDCSITKIELNSYNGGIEADPIPNHSMKLVDWLDPKELWAPHCPSQETKNVARKQRCSAQDSRDEVNVDERRFSKLFSENFFFSDDQEFVDPKELENNSVYVPYMNEDEDFNAAYPPSDDIDEFRSIDAIASRLPEVNDGDDAKLKGYSVPYEYMRDDWLEEDEIVFKLNDGSRQGYSSSMENGCFNSQETKFTNLQDISMVSVAEYNTWINRNQNLADDSGKLSSDALGLCRDKNINAVPVITGESPKFDLENVIEVDIELVASPVRCSNFECEPVGKSEYIDAATDMNADPNYDQEYKEFENFIKLIEKESRLCFSDDLENTLQNSARAISKSTQTLPSLARNSRDLTDAATPMVALVEGEIDRLIFRGYDARKIHDQEHSSKMLSESGDTGCHKNKLDEVQDAICGSHLEYNDVETSQEFCLNDEELSCLQNNDPGNGSEMDLAGGNRADDLRIGNGSEVINECNVKNSGDEFGKKISVSEDGTPFSSFSQYMDCSSELNDTLGDALGLCRDKNINAVPIIRGESPKFDLENVNEVDIELVASPVRCSNFECEPVGKSEYIDAATDMNADPNYDQEYQEFENFIKLIEKESRLCFSDDLENTLQNSARAISKSTQTLPSLARNSRDLTDAATPMVALVEGEIDRSIFRGYDARKIHDQEHSSKMLSESGDTGCHKNKLDEVQDAICGSHLEYNDVETSQEFCLNDEELSCLQNNDPGNGSEMDLAGGNRADDLRIGNGSEVINECNVKNSGDEFGKKISVSEDGTPFSSFSQYMDCSSELNDTLGDALGLCRDKNINAVPIIRGESPKFDLENVNEVDIELVASQVRCSNFECEPVGKSEYIDAATDMNAEQNYDQEYQEFENFIKLIEKESRLCFSDDLENTHQNSASAISKSMQTLPVTCNSTDLKDAATPLVDLVEGEIGQSISRGYDARNIHDQEHSSKMLSESGDTGCHKIKLDEVQDAICGSNLKYSDVETSQVFRLNNEELSCLQNNDPGNGSEMDLAGGNRADDLRIGNVSEVINECNVKNSGDEFGKKISVSEDGTPFSSFSQYMDCSSELNDTLGDALGLCRDKNINAVPIIRGESPKFDLENVNEVDIELVASQVRCSNFECEPVGKSEYIDAATDMNAEQNYDQEYQEFENFIKLIEKESRLCFSDDLENTHQNSASAISKSMQTLPVTCNSTDLKDAATPLVDLVEGEIGQSISRGYDARNIHDQEHSSKMLSESGDTGCHKIKLDEVQDAICGSNLKYSDVETSQVFRLNNEELSCLQNNDPGNGSEMDLAGGNRADDLRIGNVSEVINECNVKKFW